MPYLKGDGRMHKTEEYLNYYDNIKFYHSVYKSSDLKKEFDKVKTEEANLIAKIAPRKNIELYQAIYYYLAWNGYFSVDRNFKATSETSIELNTDMGIGIACGNGCCRNFALHFKSLLELLDKDVTLILVGTKYYYKKTPFPKINGISQNVDKKSFQRKIKLDSWKYPSHLEVLHMPSQEEPEILDPFNFNVQRLIREKESPFKKRMMDLGSAIIFDLDMNYATREELKNRKTALEKRLTRNRLEKMSIEDRKRLCQEAITLCEEKHSLLENHQQKMNPTYQYIKRETRNFQNAGY